VSRSFYDVILLGMDTSTLACGALLAKRGFRVLVLGQQIPTAEYSVGPYRLPRAPFTWSAARSPVAQRMLTELGCGPNMRRLSQPLEPAYQVALPGHRFDVPTAEADLEREIEREFNEVKRPAREHFRQLRERAEATDRLLARDIALPPQTFLERRELARAAAGIGLDRDGGVRDPLMELPERHPFRAAALVPTCFAASVESSSLTPLQLCRLQAGLVIQAAQLTGGAASLHALLADRIRSCSGELRPGEHAAEILVRRGAVHGVRLFGTDEEVGASVVATCLDLNVLTRLLEDRRPLLELFERIGEPQPRQYRYTMNVVLQRGALPDGMARDVYCVRDVSKPLAYDNVFHIEAARADRHAVLCVETLIAARTVEERDDTLDHTRERLIDALAEIMPFVREHILAIDSPHDGRPPHGEGDTPLTVEVGERRGPQTMRGVYAFPVTSALGLCAMPVRTTIGGLLLCGSQVAPGLGVEGELLAASAAARVVCRADRKQPWLRRRLWPKVEM
jgi:phytoene dehydrogenase-like protein